MQLRCHCAASYLKNTLNCISQEWLPRSRVYHGISDRITLSTDFILSTPLPVWNGTSKHASAPLNPFIKFHHTSATSGLFEWSMKYQDGLHAASRASAEEFTPERRAWLEEAMKDFMQVRGLDTTLCIQQNA